jgi:nucleoside-diphosphate-sugar epimerase
MKQEKILITGASGQLGVVLTSRLQEKWGVSNVIATDLRMNNDYIGRFEVLDATDFIALNKLIVENAITQVYHLAAILSANGENDPLCTWDVNMKTIINVLEVARIYKINKVFFPSSIAVFGGGLESENIDQFPNLTPSTVYGMSKVSGENWANYYFEKYGLDVRSIRYPGVIGYQSLPNGGTTDYAVDIFHKAVFEEKFECFLEPDTALPMIYMDDVIRATIELMDAPKENISVRTAYNLSGMSFSPLELTHSIQKIYPDFEVSYNADFRQKIAESWPSSIDDSVARRDWNWKPRFDIDKMSKTMINKLKSKYSVRT